MVFAAIGTSANGDAYDSASVRVASKRLRQRPDHLGHCVEVQGWLTQLGTGQPVAMEVTTFSFDVSEGWKNIQAGRVADVLCQMMSPSGFGHIIVRDGSNTATVEVSYTRVDRVLRASGCTWTRSIAPPSSCTCLWARNLETLPMVSSRGLGGANLGLESVWGIMFSLQACENKRKNTGTTIKMGAEGVTRMLKDSLK